MLSVTGTICKGKSTTFTQSGDMYHRIMYCRNTIYVSQGYVLQRQLSRGACTTGTCITGLFHRDMYHGYKRYTCRNNYIWPVGVLWDCVSDTHIAGIIIMYGMGVGDVMRMCITEMSITGTCITTTGVTRTCVTGRHVAGICIAWTHIQTGFLFLEFSRVFLHPALFQGSSSVAVWSRPWTPPGTLSASCVNCAESAWPTRDLLRMLDGEIHVKHFVLEEHLGGREKKMKRNGNSQCLFLSPCCMQVFV